MGIVHFGYDRQSCCLLERGSFFRVLEPSFLKSYYIGFVEMSRKSHSTREYNHLSSSALVCDSAQ